MMTKEERRIYNKGYRKKNKDKIVKQQKGYGKGYRKRPEVKERRKEYCKKNKDNIAKRTKEHHLKIKYGITLEDYKELLKQQGGVCAICRKNENRKIKFLSVDHDHKTGEVRGLLCNYCNSTLGYSKDNIDRLLKCAEYLNKYKSKK